MPVPDPDAESILPGKISLGSASDRCVGMLSSVVVVVGGCSVGGVMVGSGVVVVGIVVGTEVVDCVDVDTTATVVVVIVCCVIIGVVKVI